MTLLAKRPAGGAERPCLIAPPSARLKGAEPTPSSLFPQGLIGKALRRRQTDRREIQGAALARLQRRQFHDQIHDLLGSAAFQTRLERLAAGLREQHLAKIGSIDHRGQTHVAVFLPLAGQHRGGRDSRVKGYQEFHPCAGLAARSLPRQGHGKRSSSRAQTPEQFDRRCRGQAIGGGVWFRVGRDERDVVARLRLSPGRHPQTHRPSRTQQVRCGSRAVFSIPAQKNDLRPLLVHLDPQQRFASPDCRAAYETQKYQSSQRASQSPVLRLGGSHVRSLHHRDVVFVAFAEFTFARPHQSNRPETGPRSGTAYETSAISRHRVRRSSRPSRPVPRPSPSSR